ncbi:MAG TPA: hypothetical protein VK211_16200, partial [Kamptonema sp.]|nr:hypothetical protein [Kamptonema sp.]
MANDKPVKTRKRSYNLNPKGWQQLQNAIADWARTNSEKANGEKLANFVRLSKDTIDKILQGEAVEKNSWCAIFRAFNIIFSNDYLLLDESQSQTQVIIPNHLIGNLPSDAPQTRWVGRQPLIKDIIEKLQGN